MKKTLEQYLQEVHARQYEGLDDDMPDNFDNWVANLSEKELQQYEADLLKQNIDLDIIERFLEKQNL